jgi:hypothetical protein
MADEHVVHRRPNRFDVVAHVRESTVLGWFGVGIGRGAGFEPGDRAVDVRIQVITTAEPVENVAAAASLMRIDSVKRGLEFDKDLALLLVAENLGAATPNRQGP